jgi:hypothetical protein
VKEEGDFMFLFLSFVFINKNGRVGGSTWWSLEKLNNLKGIKKGAGLYTDYHLLGIQSLVSWHLKCSTVTTIFHNLGQQTINYLWVLCLFLQK